MSDADPGPQPGDHGGGAPPPAAARTSLAEDLRAVLPAWLAARVLVGLAWGVARAVAQRDRPSGTTLQLEQGLLAWDGAWYDAIATYGYGGTEALVGSNEALRFFPLYPLLARWLSWPLGGHEGAVLVVVANLAALAVAVAVRRLVRFEKGDDALADRAMWLVVLFPPAFVLVWAYSEALFLLGAIGALGAARARRWWWAAAFAAVAGLTRPLGLLLVLPLAWEAWEAWRSRPGAPPRRRPERDVPVGRRAQAGRRWWLGATAAVAAPAVATAGYLAWVGATTGEALAPFTVQAPLRGSADPVSRLVRGAGDLLGPERWGDGLHLPFAVAFVVLAGLTFRWWPRSYGILAVVLLLAALSADNLNSLERYGLNAVPLVLALAVACAAPRIERLAVAVCGCGLVALCALAWLGVYVP